MNETFSAALRAEIEALVMRYEALMASRVDLAALAASRGADDARAELTAARAELAAARAERDDLARELASARSKIESLEAENRVGAAAASAFEEQFAAEKRFVEAASSMSGTLLEGALELAIGRKIEHGPSMYAALKAKGLEAVLLASVKERGRTVAHAPLLEREKAILPALATIAGCELVSPAHGTRFSSSAMEKAATMSDPAEEGNVVDCLLPGLRRAGTDGALVFPRVRVATG